MIRRLLALVTTALLITTAGFAAPAEATVSYAKCNNHIVQAKAYGGIHMYFEPNTSSGYFGDAVRGSWYDCASNAVILGGRYTNCGGTNVNAWIAINWGKENVFYVYAVCFIDALPGS
jgi:hypothetical protein